MLRRVAASAYAHPRSMPFHRVALRGYWDKPREVPLSERLSDVTERVCRAHNSNISMALRDLQNHHIGKADLGPAVVPSAFRKCYAHVVHGPFNFVSRRFVEGAEGYRGQLVLVGDGVNCVLSEVRAFVPAIPPYLGRHAVPPKPNRVHEEEFKCPDEFQRACGIDSTSTTIALHGERGAGKTTLAVWGPQCPVLYLNGPFEDFYPLPAAVAVRSEQCGTRWGRSVHRDEDRGTLAAAYVLSKILPKLQNLGLVADWRAPRHCSDYESSLRGDVFFDVKMLSECVDRAKRGKNKMKKGKKITVVLDDMHGTADFLRCLRQPGGQFLEDTLRRLLCVKKVIVVLVGAPRDIPGCTHVDVAPKIDAPKIDASVVWAEQPRLVPVFKAVQGNAQLSACVSECFGHRDDCMNIKGGMPETASSIITRGLSDYVRLGTHGAIQMTSPNACARAAALVLFQHDRVLMDRMVHGTGKKLTASGAVAQIVTTTPSLVPDEYMYRLSPAQWLAAAQVRDKDWTSKRVDEASMECPFGPNSVAAFLRLTLRAAVSAQASIPQWIDAVRRAVSDPATHHLFRRSVSSSDGITARGDLSRKLRVATVFSRATVARPCDAPNEVRDRLSPEKIVLLVNGEARDSFIVLFPSGVRVFLQLKPVHVSVGSDTLTVPGLGVATGAAPNAWNIPPNFVDDPKTQLGDTPFWFPQDGVSLASLFFSED